MRTPIRWIRAFAAQQGRVEAQRALMMRAALISAGVALLKGKGDEIYHELKAQANGR